MASIVVAGDTSGTVTLAAPAVSGTTTLTLPTTSGTIVTTSGSQTIEFADGSASAPSITNSGDNNTGMFFPAADTIAFSEGGAESMRIDSSGNVGIGTTSPSNKLDIFNSNFGGTNTSLILSSVNSAAAKINYAGLGYECSQGSAGIEGGGMLFSTYGSGALSERMRITSSGKLVMASTTDGLIGSIQAGITANTASTNAIIISAATANGPYPIGARGESTNQGLVGFFNSSDTAIASITKSGNSVAYNTSSDYRLKENITPMTGALNKVLLLKPVTYTWKEDGLTGQGFIAHELQAIVPDAVTGEKDAVETYTDKDGIEQTRIKPQGVDTSFLVATLTAAIQEQQTIIETLKADIAELKAKVK